MYDANMIFILLFILLFVSRELRMMTLDTPPLPLPLMTGLNDGLTFLLFYHIKDLVFCMVVFSFYYLCRGIFLIYF